MDDIFEAEQEKSVPVKEPFDIERCSPTPPDRVGREFVLKYYTIMNRSPENLHCFYTDTASFTHDDIDPMQRRTVTANCKKEINEVMLERIKTYQHTKTKVSTVDSIDTLGDGVMVQVNGEISFNEQPMRPFSQTIILFRKTPFHYYVQNDIFRFCDFVEELEPEKCDNIAEMPPKDMPEDWGSQCEEFESEPRAESTQRETRRGNRRNEVKLDTSDSGLSSDTEKVIMDIQSINLKNILQEPRQITKESVMKRGPTPTGSSEIEAPAGETETGDNDISDNHTQSFRDSCILMINNVVNPNIEFDEAKRDEALASETEKAKENAESANTSKSDESGSSKNRYKKRKEKRKSKGDISRDISREKSLDKAHNEPDIEVQSNDSIDERTLTAEESVSPEESIEKNEETPGVSEPKREEMPKPLESKHEETPKQSKPIEREPPVTTEKISYAELARAGKDEWVDELATRRESLSNKGKHRNPRRNSRGEKTTPSHASSQSSAGSSHEFSRFSPKNDQLQVFVGNIPHTAGEEDIRKLFSRFGRLSRVRLLSNTRKEWLPRYAFLSYENVHAVQQCLMKKNTFYWPENSPDRQKLNVNGDPSIDVWDDSGNRKSDTNSSTRDYKQFTKHFSRDAKTKRSPELNSSFTDTKNERRKGSKA